MTGRLSLGVAAALDHRIVAELAARMERAGFAALWVNDTPGADALAALRVAAESTTTLTLAAGVLPLDRRPPAAILDDVARLALPADRLVLGVGSGARSGAGVIASVRADLEQLRAATDIPVLLGALGPRMRSLAATAADGPLLSWLTPDAAARMVAELPRLGGEPRSVLYARATVDPAARPRLEAEAARYASYPQYAAHFQREGIDPMQTVVAEADAGRLAAYLDAVDELVLRAIPAEESLGGYLEFVDHPGLREAVR